MITKRSVAARALTRTAAVAALTAGALAGCNRTATPVNPSTAFLAEAQAVRANAPETRPWFCNAVGNGTPLSGHGNGHIQNPIYAGKTKGPLSWDDCLALSRQLDQLVTAVRPYSTRGKAQAAGSVTLGNYEAGIGTHHSFPGGGSAVFNPARPPILTYGGDEPDAPLMGVAWSYAGPTPPAAFAGGNDWWHSHRKVCFEKNPKQYPPRDLGNAEEISDEQCAALGGVQTTFGNGIWLLHLWLPPMEYRLDLFASGHPCLLATHVAPPSDPCWTIAKRDPSEGLPPGTDPSHGADHGS